MRCFNSRSNVDSYNSIFSVKCKVYSVRTYSFSPSFFRSPISMRTSVIDWVRPRGGGEAGVNNSVIAINTNAPEPLFVIPAAKVDKL